MTVPELVKHHSTEIASTADTLFTILETEFHEQDKGEVTPEIEVLTELGKITAAIKMATFRLTRLAGAL